MLEIIDPLRINRSDKPWNWISRNPNITLKFILDHPDKPWVWRQISMNPNITIKNILDNPDKPWNWEDVGRNTFDSERKQFLKRGNIYNLAKILVSHVYVRNEGILYSLANLNI